MSHQKRAALLSHRKHLLSKGWFDFPARRASDQESNPHLLLLLGRAGPLRPQGGISHGLVSPVPVATGCGPSFTSPLGAEASQCPRSPSGADIAIRAQHLPPLPATLCHGRKNLSPGQFRLVGLGVAPPCPRAAHQPISPHTLSCAQAATPAAQGSPKPPVNQNGPSGALDGNQFGLFTIKS